MMLRMWMTTNNATHMQQRLSHQLLLSRGQELNTFETAHMNICTPLFGLRGRLKHFVTWEEQQNGNIINLFKCLPFRLSYLKKNVLCLCSMLYGCLIFYKIYINIGSQVVMRALWWPFSCQVFVFPSLTIIQLSSSQFNLIESYNIPSSRISYTGDGDRSSDAGTATDARGALEWKASTSTLKSIVHIFMNWKVMLYAVVYLYKLESFLHSLCTSRPN